MFEVECLDMPGDWVDSHPHVYYAPIQIEDQVGTSTLEEEHQQLQQQYQQLQQQHATLVANEEMSLSEHLNSPEFINQQDQQRSQQQQEEEQQQQEEQRQLRRSRRKQQQDQQQQRQLRRSRRQQKLQQQNDELSPPSELTFLEQVWEDRFQDLKAYYKKYGHSNVPSTQKKVYFSLGRWCGTQRLQYTELTNLQPEWYKQKRPFRVKPFPLTKDRIDKLNSVGFVWPENCKNALTAQRHADAVTWNDHFEQLKEYHRKYGHSEVPHRYKPNLKLRSWISKQRSNYKQYLLKTQKEKKSNTRQSLRRGPTKTGLSPFFTQERFDKLASLDFNYLCTNKKY
jgi:hypothetical protein